MKKIYKASIIAGTFMPMLVFAQTGVEDILNTFGSLINRTIPILIGLAVLVFIWGVIQFISASGDEEKRAAGRQHMIWGIIGIAVIVAIWGFVQVLLNTFDIGTGSTTIPVPTIQDLE